MKVLKSPSRSLRFFCLALFVVPLLYAHRSLGQIQNGSFENSFTGWTQTGFNTVLGPSWNPNAIGTDGIHAAAIGTFDVANSSLSQTIGNVGTGSYTIQFDWFADAEGIPNIAGALIVSAFRNGSSLATQTFTSMSGSVLKDGSKLFQAGSLPLSVPAGTGPITVTFADGSPNGGIRVDPVVDNIRLVPEASTQAYLFCGGLLGLVLRKLNTSVRRG